MHAVFTVAVYRTLTSFITWVDFFRFLSMLKEKRMRRDNESSHRPLVMSMFTNAVINVNVRKT